MLNFMLDYVKEDEEERVWWRKSVAFYQTKNVEQLKKMKTKITLISYELRL